MSTAAQISSTTVVPSASDASFAGILASLAAPPGPEFGSDDDGLADDVASISYEHALRTHARSQSWHAAAELPAPDSPPQSAIAAPKPLKTASITIRLSEPECAKLRERAAETGLSVSAYLRSCTLEVESLRAQVKDTLAQLRNSAPSASEPESEGRRAGWFQRLLNRLRRQAARFVRKPQPDFELNPANPFAPARY